MRKRSGVVTALITFLSSVTLVAQQLATFYSVDQGLPQSTVTSLYRDNSGFLWVGTGDGLGVFDGWGFQQIRKNSENKASITNAAIRGIIASQDQKTVWVGTEGGINQFDRFTLRLIKKFDVVRKPGIAQSPILANDTAVWMVAANVGLCRVRISDGKMTVVSNRGFEGCYALLSDGKTVVYTDSSNSIVSVDLVTGKSVSRKLSYGLSKYSVLAFRSLPGTEREVLVLTLHGLFVMNSESCVLRRYTLGCKSVVDSTMRFRSVTFHPDGSWWFAVIGDGVYRYDPVAKSMRACFWQQNGTYFADQMKASTAILCDEYGVVWCGTDGFGLVKMLHGRIMFRGKYNSEVITDTCNWFTRCFYELSSERYLVGTFQNGLNLIDESKNTITPLAREPLVIENTPLFITGGGGHSLLIGSNQGLRLLDTLNWTFAPMTGGSPLTKRFTGFLRCKDGRLLVYGEPGIYEYIDGPIPHLSEQAVGNYEGLISCVYQKKDGTIIAALVHRGLAEISTDWSDHKLFDFEKTIGLHQDVLVRGMFEDHLGRLWLGTDGGMVAIDDNYKIAGNITTENGLPDNTIYDTEELSGGIVAISTGHGLVLYNSGSDDMSVYNYADGLPSNECNSGALLFAASGAIYVGTTMGFVKWESANGGPCFRAATVLISESTPEGMATGIVRESIVQDYGGAAVDLLVWQTDFAFPERVVFEYQLEGSGEAKTRVAGLRKLNYAALSSGFYSFMCTAEVPGCPVPKIAKLFTIKIIPPYWMSGWFIGIIAMAGVVLITLILFIVMRVRYQRKIRKLKMQQELDKVRQRISRDIHDEIGAGLTRIALSGDLMSKKFGEADPAFDKLKWIAGTARELSQNMKEVVWSVNPHYDSLDHMFAYFRSHASDVAERADMRFTYSGDDKFPDIPVNPEARRNLLLILKETLSNMVKHAGATELSLDLRWKHNRISMVIADNGVGFDLNSPEKINSNGLRNLRQRAESIGCVISITSIVGTGTRTEVSGSVSAE